MNTIKAINIAKENCTDSNGILDKTLFRVMVAMLFCAEPDERKESDELISFYNKEIRLVLGSGHSLISCLQFCEGKKAKSYVDIIMKAAATKVNEIGLSQNI